MKDAPMFEDPELPDFDSMSQEELIEWLEQLAKSHGTAASEFLDDYGADETSAAGDELADDDDWSGWLDDKLPGAREIAAEDSFIGEAGLGSGDPDPPVDLSLLDDEDSAATASLDWLDEIIAAQNAAEVPDFNKLETESQTAGNPHGLPNADDDDDPLDWLNNLDSNGLTASSGVEIPDDFDETWEDDETLDDLEDESLYSSGADKSSSFLESLAGLEDREAEQHSTQSMAPVPDTQPVETPQASESIVVASADRDDSLTRAFLIQEHDTDLEAWYTERLRVIAAGAAEPEQPAPVKPGKPPPPGLKAAIFSARDKVKADKLAEALLDYETLLGTTAGLQWVVHDMRELIAQERYRDMPAVHRVLGDALMRQGHLNAALNVYRHALSLL